MCPPSKIKKGICKVPSDNKVYEVKAGRTVMEESVFDEVLMERLSDKATFEQSFKERSEPC